MKNVYLFKPNLFSIIILLIILLPANYMLADNGKIRGRVTDASTGEPIPYVNVVIISTVLPNGKEVPLDIPMGAPTDIDGYFFILNVPPGVYSIKASAVGYTPVTQKGVKVELDRSIKVDFQISETTVEVGQVVIVAKRELVKQDVSATQEIIESSRLEEMPVTRVDEFIGTLKGVQLVSGSEGNGLSIRGGSIRETDVTLDGISLRDPRTGNSYLALNSTSIKEMQVLTGGFEAKYGDLRSGLLNVVTKEGSRERYTASFRIDVTPSGQNRFFGTNPYSADNSNWIYRLFAGSYAMHGYQPSDTLLPGDQRVPVSFQSFKGWASKYSLPLSVLDSAQRRDLWLKQHPMYDYANKPDYFVEGTITGPVPGAGIPLWGDFAERSTFLIGGKYENSQLAFPTGPRDNYIDWNAQLKLTTLLQGNMKLSVDGLYANTNTNSGGRATSFGGALTNSASSFSFLNSTQSSVEQQGSLLSGNNMFQMFNKSRLQYYNQRYMVGGAKFTHTISDKSFYTLDYQMGYTDQNLSPFAMDTSNASNYVYYYSQAKKQDYRFLVPNYGSPNASTNYQTDVLNMFNLTGGPQRVDSSYTWVFSLRGDYTAQLGRHHQFEAGFDSKYEDYFIYTGTWFQAQLAYTPDTWQYIKARTFLVGLYAQDKLEFEGMILNAGLRLDYLNPLKDGFQVGFPEDPSYAALLNDIYPNLPGTSQQWDRWSYFRSLLQDPPGWPRTPDKVQAYLSPRLGVSFPITESSKLYFNYGHFYQRPPVDFMYDVTVVQGGVTVPTPELAMAKTVSYEFGYEQMIFNDFIVNVTAYYKDISDEPLPRTFVNYYGDNLVTKYYPDAYRDIRGVELRFERPIGQFVTFNAMYDYMVQSSGQSGLDVVYEDMLLARNGELRNPNMNTIEPLPRANVTLNLHTPTGFGPYFLGGNWLENIFANFFFEWQSGGTMLMTPPDNTNRIYANVINRWNIDFRGSKTFTTAWGTIDLVVTIENITNNKWLIPENMTQTQYDDYKNSLMTPDKGGSDEWGQYKSSDNHIKIGSWTAPIFLNPRRVIVGMRLNF